MTKLLPSNQEWASAYYLTERATTTRYIKWFEILRRKRVIYKH